MANTIFRCYCGRTSLPHALGCVWKGQPFYAARDQAAGSLSAAPRRNGCHNRPPLGATRRVQDGWDVTQDLNGNGITVPRMRIGLQHRLSIDCQYTTSEAGRVDPGCTGCRWRAP